MKDMAIDEGGKGVITPGSNGEGGQDVKDDKTESRFGAVASRGNHLGQDTVDMQYAAKEISRFMSTPEEQDWRTAKRLARYLMNHRRIVLEYKYQERPKKVVVWSDTDFAGCGRTRKSTSGGVVQEELLCLVHIA